jgi:nucleotide-binding universal stress UspA family protein
VIEAGLRPEYARNPVRRGPIVLAVKDAEMSRGPAVAAKLLAERLGVPLEIVTVLEQVPLYGNAGFIPSTAAPIIEAARRDDRVRALEEYTARFLDDLAPPHTQIRYGSVSRELSAAARELNATAIVVGAAPHRRRSRVIGGERAAQILRRADCPVLSIAPGFTELPRQAVVGTDFSPSSVRAASAALLMLADGGTLLLLHAMEPFDHTARLRDGSDRDRDTTAVQQLFTQLQTELQPLVASDIVVSTRVIGQDAVTGLLEAAEETGATLIAVGTHGPNLVERVFAGSIASSILHSAEQTVLAAPPPSAADALAMRLRLWGTAVTHEPDDWTEALDAFTKRNAGRRVTVEVDDPEIGAQIVESGYGLLGVVYDPNDRRVEIMVGDSANPVRHHTHTIAEARSIAISSADDGRDEALEVTHGDGHTLLLFARDIVRD